ncbi:MAG: 3-hydroxy-3-methylglutaryl-CoA reductase, partial [Anaerolineae bacterium]|nr:3-hydroxy-3-methylglutaryl-CoA reductase [Anaerolineae bacterium]
MIGQIQVLDVPDMTAAVAALVTERDRILAAADEVDPVIRRLGSGRDDRPGAPGDARGPMPAVHLVYDVRDAMGANVGDTACERLAPLIAEITGGRIGLRILSNLADRRLAWAECSIPV